PVIEQKYCPVKKIALDALKVLGLVLMAAGVGCFIAGLQAPAISLLVTGVASLVLGFVLQNIEEKDSGESSAPALSKQNLNSGAAISEDAAVNRGADQPDPLNAPMKPETPQTVSTGSLKAPSIDSTNQALRAKIASIPVLPVPERGQVVDKLAAATMGQTLGDALGLATEFKSKAEAKALFQGQALELGNPAFSDEAWAGQFPRGGFTDDTEQATTIIRAIDQHQKHPEKPLEIHFAEQLHHWLKNGLDSFKGQYISNEPEPIQGCRDAGNLTRTVLSHPDFQKNPLEVARRIWALSKPASNGSVMRTSVVGAIYYQDLTAVVEKTVLFARVTHADPRSISAAVALSFAIALLLRGHYSVEEVTNHSLDVARIVLRAEMERNAAFYRGQNLEDLVEQYSRDLETHIRGTWDTLNLEESDKIGYAYKCMGAAFCALRRAEELVSQRHAEPFRTVIQEIVEEGGDADTNAAAAGALIGTYLGSWSIPASWVGGLNENSQAVLQENEAMIKRLSGV
ncbi:MAG TPA: ADP-ribosylglycohydrolase family protein, partial [Chlamydiales bacterium]|nr:ADP-ribosylglycohydrolase family protein [Chlamydiales bacterium]